MREPYFCFTSDIDWASEAAIDSMLRLFDTYSIPLTPFITHDSPVLRTRYATTALKERVGLHPNFLAGSTHGGDVSHVIDHVQRLWPEARGFRSHSFVDSSPIASEMIRRGLCYDSNLCLWLQPNCVPLAHQSGLVRFPVFWEDDVHFDHAYPFELEWLREFFDRPGLKVINIHAIHVALNTPSTDFYGQRRHLSKDITSDELTQSAYTGAGTRTLLEDMLNYVRQRGYQAHFLHDLFQKITVTERTSNDPSQDAQQSSAPIVVGSATALDQYQKAATQERAEIVRSIYEQRDTKQLYATSPDFHLRELEIGFLAEHVRPGKVLDLGCGNGYTLLSLARRVAADYVGLDFSPKMIEGAAALTQQCSSELKSIPKFQEADVRALTFADSTYDTVLSERCLLNLPSRDDQWQTIREIHRVLKPGGLYLMVEGTEDGLERLNVVRDKMKLEPIPTASPENPSSLKFRESELEAVLEPLFTIEKKQYFGLYYLISRVLHPILVEPERPKFDSKINAIARALSEVCPIDSELGHVVGYKLIAKK